MREKLSIIISKTKQNSAVQEILRQELGLTRHQISSAKFLNPGICRNGQPCKVTERVREGDLIEVYLAEASVKKVTPTIIPTIPGKEILDICYEDEDLLIVNKPPYMAVHPGHGHYADTLSNLVQYYLSEKQEDSQIHLIGRLDKDTSGLVVFAKHKLAAARLQELTEKEYIAAAHGWIMQEEGSITYPLRKMPGHLNRMEAKIPMTMEAKTPTTMKAKMPARIEHKAPTITAAKSSTGIDVDEDLSDSSSWMRAVTHYRVQQRIESGNGELVSQVELTLETGRTHQIRVHMAAIGHPLVGDPIYGAAQPLRAMLHCRKIRLIHPFTGKKLIVTASLPEDMKRILQQNI